ncbi:hypothetical protein ACH5RR_005445 [Cinchona calisaya]|uniref:C2H2-type domain-containing protein n=1 Tax=Cinchona calisaya TaxID=153742 RepID=A0ABD3AL85_9GENT
MLVMSENMFTVPSSSVKGFAHQEPADAANPNNNIPKSNSASKKKRNQPGNPDPDSEVIALSPKTLMATNRFICEICNKGFQRDQNLQLHRRGHNLPWKLKQRNNKEQVKRKVYVCPEKSCVHHDPSRALGDLTGIKKHFSRKHGEKKWKCEKCSKKYAVQSDWKAHSKTCGTREYKCDCGTLFSRKDSFITHRAFCDALAEESARITSVGGNTNLSFKTEHLNGATLLNNHQGNFPQIGVDFGSRNHHQLKPGLSLWLDQQANNPHQLNTAVDMSANSNLYLPSGDIMQMANLFGSSSSAGNYGMLQPSPSSSAAANLSLSGLLPQQGSKEEEANNKRGGAETLTSLYSSNQNTQSKSSAAPMSATALLQKAAQMGSTKSNPTTFFGNSFGVMNSSSSSSNTPANFNGSGLPQNRNELLQVFGKQLENVTGTATSLSAAAADGMLGASNLSSSTSSMLTNNLDQSIMQTSKANDRQSGTLNFHPGFNGVVEHSSLTRDFLGMGGDGGRPFLPHELAKFASMNSAMGLGHFSGNH